MTVTPAAPPIQTAADFTPEQLDLRERARRFVDDVLIPNEELAERSGGKIPDELKRADQARGGRGAAVGRASRRRARRAGLVEGRVVPRRGAARALHQRALVAHARRVQRARQRLARADRALPEAGAAGRAARRLRRDRGRGGLGPVADRDDGAPERRRLGDRWREVVRDLRGRGGGVHRHGERARGRREAARPCSWSTARSTASRSSTSRPSPTPTRTAIRRSASTASRWRRTR